MREKKNMRTVVDAAVLVILTAAVSALVTITVLENAGCGLLPDEPAKFEGTYDMGEGARLSLLPCEDDVDGGIAPFYIYEMTDDPGDDELKVTASGYSKRRGDGCLVLFGDGGEAFASVFCCGDIWYFQRAGAESGLPLRIGKIDDEALVPVR